MKNKQIIDSWDKIKADRASHDRILNNILNKVHQKKKGKGIIMRKNQNHPADRKSSPNAGGVKRPSRTRERIVRFAGIAAALVILAAGGFFTSQYLMNNGQDQPSASGAVSGQPTLTPEPTPTLTPTPEPTPTSPPAPQFFSFTRADRRDIDAERNSQIFLLSQAESDTLNQLLRTGEWTEATDVPAMGLEPPYVFYEKNGDHLSLNRWSAGRCLMVKRYADDAERIDRYYAPESVMDSVLAFMSECTPLPGKLNGQSEWYFDLFHKDPAFKMLVNFQDESSDARMAAYAICRMGRMGDYSYEEGNTKEEYDVITEKYFGKKITNFDNGASEFIPGTDRIRATGWSFNGSIFMVLKSDITQNPDGTQTADFYAYEVSDSFWEDHNRAYLEKTKEELLTGNTELYSEPSVVRVVYEIKNEILDGVQESYLTYKNVTILYSPFTTALP